MPVKGHDPLTERLFALGGGGQIQEQAPDPRTKAIEQYMQQQESKTDEGWYHPDNIVPRSHYSNDQGEPYNPRDYEPERGPLELFRGLRRKWGPL